MSWNKSGTLFTENVTLEYLNEMEAANRVPVMVYLGILSVIGFVGNLHVIIVGIFRLHSGSNYRIFITILAVMDILNCILGMPFEIFDNRYPYMFDSPKACSVMRFHNTFVNIGSMIILLTIAVERFQKICRPFGNQMTKKRLVVACGVVFCISILLSCPQAIFNGHRTVKFEAYNITGVDCSVNDYFKDTSYPRMYYTFINFGIIASIVILTVLYCCVGHKLRKHAKGFGRIRSSRSSSVSTDYSNASIRRITLGAVNANGNCPNSSDNMNDGFIMTTKNMHDGNKVSSDKEETDEVFVSDGVPTPRVDRKMTTQTSFTESNNPREPVTPDVTANESHRKPSFQRQFSNKSFFQRQNSTQPFLKRQISTSEKNMIRTTRILFIITAIFIISYLPVEILIILSATKKGFSESLDKTGKNLFKIFIRSFFLNNVANPFIYGFYDKNFRKTCRKVYERIFKVCKRPFCFK